MIDRTLFFRREDWQSYGDGKKYDEYWWTYSGADDPYAPDEVTDPYAAYRQTGDGKIKKHFLLGKIARDKWDEGKRKRNLVNILGADWTVDTNEAFRVDEYKDSAVYDGVKYTSRLAFLNDDRVGANFKMLIRRKSWERMFAELRNKLAGKTWKISTSYDRWFYREGRVEVDDAKKDVAGAVEITADCDPWKYEKYSSMDTWLWDDLDFEYGIIREKSDYTLELAANTSGTVNVFPLEKPEPIYINVTNEGGAPAGHNVTLKWSGSSMDAVSYNGLTTAWKKTEFIPTQPLTALDVSKTCILEVKNVSNHPLTVQVYYRGAMR